MGKKRRLNRLISKWIKSDLPSEERSTVLLLAVTRIPTSPVAARRHPSSEAAQPTLRRNSSTASRRSAVLRRNSSAKRRAAVATSVPVQPQERRLQVPTVTVTENDTNNSSKTSCPDLPEIPKPSSLFPNNPVPKCVTKEEFSESAMESSIDSIGTCSLDVEASAANNSDWSEISSTGTLRSTQAISTSSPEQQSHHLPSYLSLACTVNGYSTTTNYDPIRLARSRDASPHRIDTDLTATNSKKPSYSVQNNLLSPPNLVPLPKDGMENTTMTQQFYSSKTVTYTNSQESRFTPNIFITKDTTDGCIENGHHTIQSKCVSLERKTMSITNNQTKCTSETSMRQEYSNGTETKSFIQQRVERLYGPGALAQGFLVMNRRLSESEQKQNVSADKHSKTLPDNLLDEEAEPMMKQSTSSPTLPVLRHLRPEFRAQLPIISPKKSATETNLQKSVTIPKLNDETHINGHLNKGEKGKLVSLKDITNGHTECSIKEESGEKDGHYFLKILEAQTKRLLELAAQIEDEISIPDLSEEVIGKLRSASGKARLLVSQKMQQFKGLCTNNINRSDGEAFPTTNEDLQGFWDMVMLQVDQVDAMFEEINKLRKNNWQEIQVESKASTNNITKTKKLTRPKPNSSVNEEVRKQREFERKKMIEERRKAMKAQQKPKESIEIFVPESS